MSKAVAMPVTCFEITQNPAEKTDYFFSVRGATAQPAQVETWLWQLHTALASPVLPDDEAIIGCPTPFGAKEESLLCLCRAKRIVPESGGRDFLHFQAVFASVGSLMQADVNQLSLYYSDVWRSMRGDGSGGVVRYSVPRAGKGRVDSNDLTRRLMGDRQLSPNVVAPSLETAVEQVHGALEQLGWKQLAETSFAIGIPDECQLPMQPTLTVRVEAPKPQVALQQTTVEPEHGEFFRRGQPCSLPEGVSRSLSAYKSYVEEIADDVCQPHGLSTLWATRLWNQCQDVLVLIEAVEKIGMLNHHQERLTSAQGTLASELERSKVNGGDHAASELRRRWTDVNIVCTPKRNRRRIAALVMVSLAVLALWWTLFVASPRRGGDAIRSNRSAIPTLSKPDRQTSRQ